MQFAPALQLPTRHSSSALLAPHLSDAALLTADTPRINEIKLNHEQSISLLVLAAILRELSHSQDLRWLCLVGAPSQLSQQWLKNVDLPKERILLMQARTGQSALELCCEALRLGRSHTVISWLQLDNTARLRLERAAHAGNSQSLNILLH